jgi:hypothetical protein
MLFRLSKLDSDFQPAARRLSALLALTVCVACSGKQFSASVSASGGASAGGSTAGAGDTPSVGGDDGSSGSSSDAGSSSGGSEEVGGAGGTSGNAGGAGKGPTGCASCTAGMYCQASVNKCRSCADFSRLEFAPPEPLSTISAGKVERFPRSAGAGSALFYTEDSAAERAILYASAPTSGVGVPLADGSSTPLGNDSGPLLAAGFVEKNFFFDRTQVNGRRKIMVGNWAGGILSDVVAASTPTNMAGADDYSFAAAPSAGHAYWMSTRNGSAQLIWESINETPMVPPDVLPLKIRIGANADCDRLGADATPWVNLAGTLLLFSAESMADTCEQNDSHAHDLFAVPLAKSGLPASAAIPLSVLNITGGGSDETDPSLSPDSCSIYYASDSGTGDYDLYRAARN